MSTTGHTHINPTGSDHSSPRTPAESAVVVIGLDGSAASWDAFWWACGEATRLHGRAIAVHVSPLVATTAVAAAPDLTVCCDYQALHDAATEHAAELRAEAHRQAAGQSLDLTFIHTWGDPVDELLRVSRAVEATLIAVGRSTKLGHRIAGSLGRRLISKQCVPLIVVVP